MPTQETTPDIISSILLAAWQIHLSRPEKTLAHLVNPTPPKDYRYLDAIATLCSLVPECDSASAAIEVGAEANHLFIATSPTASPTLRKAMTTWIHSIQQIQAMFSSPKAPIDAAFIGSLDNTEPIRNFIESVYRVCYHKLLDDVRDDDAKDLQEELSTASNERMEELKVKADQLPSLVKALEVMIEMAKPDFKVTEASVEEIMALHDAARTSAKFKERFLDADYIVTASRLYEAVNSIISFAISRNNQAGVRIDQDVTWIDAADSHAFIATMNTKEFMLGISDEDASHLKIPDDFTDPPRYMSKVDGFTDRFKGTGAVHCEGTLLKYILDHDLSVDRYIGASQPVCYACLMLVRACNWVFKKAFVLGRRSGTMDPTWRCPEMGAQLHDKLVSSLKEDLWMLCDTARVDQGDFRSKLNKYFTRPF